MWHPTVLIFLYPQRWKFLENQHRFEYPFSDHLSKARLIIHSIVMAQIKPLSYSKMPNLFIFYCLFELRRSLFGRIVWLCFGMRRWLLQKSIWKGMLSLLWRRILWGWYKYALLKVSNRMFNLFKWKHMYFLYSRLLLAWECMFESVHWPKALPSILWNLWTLLEPLLNLWRIRPKLYIMQSWVSVLKLLHKWLPWRILFISCFGESLVFAVLITLSIMPDIREHLHSMHIKHEFVWEFMHQLMSSWLFYRGICLHGMCQPMLGVCFSW